MADNLLMDKSVLSGAENQVVTWINQLDFANAGKKLTLLRQIQEILLHQCPRVISKYLDDILCFITDRNPDVKKFLVGFIEEISKLKIDLLPRMVGNLQMLLMDVSIPVQKRVIQAANTVYKNAFVWICSASEQNDDMEKAWELLNHIKLNILNMVDCENEGIRTNSIKFLEGIIILQTYKDEPKLGDYSLDDIPPVIQFIQRRKLEEESMHIFNLLLKFHNSQHISGVNLMACTSALCEVAKARPKFLPKVIQALGSLQSTLPPTLSQSQTNSVKKHLKIQVLNLIRHPSSSDMVSPLLHMLPDLGMTPQEIAKLIPKTERKNKRVQGLRVESGVKRARMDSPKSNSQNSDKSDISAHFTASIDDADEEVSEKSIYSGLQNINSVVNLVMATMDHLPEEIPPHFSVLYEPISNAGVIVNHSSLAKLILRTIKSELSELPPAEKVGVVEEKNKSKSNDEDERLKLKNALAKLESTKLDSKFETAITKLMDTNPVTDELAREKDIMNNFDRERLICPQTPTVPKLKQRVKSLKLHTVTKPLSQNVREKLIDGAVDRVLKAERAAIEGGGEACRLKMLATFAVSFGDQVREAILSFILDDVALRLDLALSWMYEEYTYIQGFNQKIMGTNNASKIDEKSFQNYNNLLCSLVVSIAELTDPSQEILRENLFRRVYLEAPLVTNDAMVYIKKVCCEEDKYVMGLNLLRDLILYQPTKATKYITVLLPLTVCKIALVREGAIERVVQLYKKKNESLRKAIDKHANLHLGFIALPDPPHDLLETDLEKPMEMGTWDDELYKICLQLYLAILPYNDEFLNELCRIYVGTSPDGKRCVLRLLETPVRHIGADNPTLLAMIEECPKGAETLVTRIIHILTEKAAPSPALVTRVRDLYAKRVSDVRFLIPVINGLTKSEILAALPKLIKLNPIVIREAFNKILLTHIVDNEILPQPGFYAAFIVDYIITAAELLVALHLIDPSKVELKYIIKATSLCFADKQAYTAEVLGDVLQELVEQPQLPVLLMRSVLQALSSHPMRLSSLVISILHRLITKQVWEQKVVWEGFLKCCQRLIPQSINVLTMLPPEPLRLAITSCPDLHTCLSHNVTNMTGVPHHVIETLAEFSTTEEPVQSLGDLSMKTDSMMDSLMGNEPLPPGMD